MFYQFILESLDTVVLLSGGRSIYHGPRSALFEHFTHPSIGFDVHQNNTRTMVDFLLDITSGNELATSGVSKDAFELQVGIR